MSLPWHQAWVLWSSTHGRVMGACCWDAPWRTDTGPVKPSQEQVHLRDKPPLLLPPTFPQRTNSLPHEKTRFPPSPAYGDHRLSTGWIGALVLLPSFLLLKLLAFAFQDTARRCPFVLNLPPQTNKVQQRLV